jgi:hypothetical protein
LTFEGTIIILDLFSDTRLARTYIAIKKNNLRIGWLKKQLELQIEKIRKSLEKCFMKKKTQYTISKVAVSNHLI